MTCAEHRTSWNLKASWRPYRGIVPSTLWKRADVHVTKSLWTSCKPTSLKCVAYVKAQRFCSLFHYLVMVWGIPIHPFLSFLFYTSTQGIRRKTKYSLSLFEGCKGRKALIEFCDSNVVSTWGRWIFKVCHCVIDPYGVPYYDNIITWIGLSTAEAFVFYFTLQMRIFYLAVVVLVVASVCVDGKKEQTCVI